MASATSSALIGVIAAVFGSAATIFAGGFEYFNKDKELDIQLVNIGLSILRGEATGDAESVYARRFALRLLREYTDVEIPDDDFEQWAAGGTTPFEATSTLMTPPFSSRGVERSSFVDGLYFFLRSCLASDGYEVPTNQTSSNINISDAMQNLRSSIPVDVWNRCFSQAATSTIENAFISNP